MPQCANTRRSARSTRYSAVARMRSSHHLNRQPPFADLAAAGPAETLDDVFKTAHRQWFQILDLERLRQLEPKLERRSNAGDRLAGMAFVEADVERFLGAGRDLDQTAAVDIGIRLEAVWEDARHGAARILIVTVEESVLAGARLDDERIVDAKTRMRPLAGPGLDARQHRRWACPRHRARGRRRNHRERREPRVVTRVGPKGRIAG